MAYRLQDYQRLYREKIPTRPLAAFKIVELVTEGHIFNLPRVVHEISPLETQKIWLGFLWYLLPLSF
jgi:hypothetical protein